MPLQHEDVTDFTAHGEPFGRVCSTCIARWRAHRRGEPLPPVRAARAPRKLSEEQIAELRARRSQGVQLKVLAADYGVSQSHVSLLARGLRGRSIA